MIVAIAVLAAFAVVILNNNVVNLEHGILGMREELKDAQTRNVELKEKVFGLFDAKSFSGMGSLVQDKNPEYVEVGSRGVSGGEPVASGISQLY